MWTDYTDFFGLFTVIGFFSGRGFLRVSEFLSFQFSLVFLVASDLRLLFLLLLEYLTLS